LTACRCHAVLHAASAAGWNSAGIETIGLTLKIVWG
jgi:hypothetical protein